MISIGMLRDVWAFRGFMWGSIRREFQSRWQGTQLGPVWIVANPLATILIFTVVFAQIMKPTLPQHDSAFAYSIYLCSGVLTWNLFSELLNRCVGIFIEHGNMLKKVHFPKLCLPIMVFASGLMHFAIVLALFLAFLLLTGNFPGWVILAMLPVLLVQMAFTAGLGIFLGTINVFYRDVQQTTGLILQFWFWLTPVVYTSSGLPEKVKTWLEWNPMWPLIRAYQTVFLEKTAPDWPSLALPALAAGLFVFLGVLAFHRLQGEIVDEL